MKKALAILLVVGVISTALTGFALAESAEHTDGEAPLPIPHYLPITGTIVSVQDLDDSEGRYMASIEDSDGNPAMLVITEETVFPFSDKYDVGDTVTGFYQANLPMIMIWPPQYNIAILVAGAPTDVFIKADRFFELDDYDGDYFFSTDGLFGFRVGDETEIILANGDNFENAELAGRRIVVIYDVSTRSIPELATARKLIVLYEDAVPLPGGLVSLNISDMPILVDGAQITAPAAFLADDGVTVMVPLRAIAEALGYEVIWQGMATRSIVLTGEVELAIDSLVYHHINGPRAAVVDSGPAPILLESVTYVPLHFFSRILGMPNAFAFEGQIEIHSEGEPME